MKAIKALLFTAVLSLTHASAADTVWSASEDNGDKPGIGFRLVQGQRGISGAAYLLDPKHAHDFSHGTKRKITVTDSSQQEVRFKLDWGDGKQRSYILQFDAPSNPSPSKELFGRCPRLDSQRNLRSHALNPNDHNASLELRKPGRLAFNGSSTRGSRTQVSSATLGASPSRAHANR